MTDTLQVSNVLDRDGITAHRDVWVRDIEATRSRVVALEKEIVEMKSQELALSGALQACDIFLKQLSDGSKITNVNLVPTQSA